MQADTTRMNERVATFKRGYEIGQKLIHPSVEDLRNEDDNAFLAFNAGYSAGFRDKITQVRTQKSKDTVAERGSYRKARGAVPLGKDDLPPEETVRIMRGRP